MNLVFLPLPYPAHVPDRKTERDTDGLEQLRNEKVPDQHAGHEERGASGLGSCQLAKIIIQSHSVELLTTSSRLPPTASPSPSRQ